MQVKRVVYADRDQFLADYLKDFPTGGLFVAGGDACELGEAIVLEISFPDLPEGIFISGRTVWRRMPTRWKSSLTPGVGVQFDAAERAKRDFLLDFARGAVAGTRKRTRRIPARLRVDYAPLGQGTVPTRGETRDIGRGGLFLLTGALPGHGASIEMMVYPPTPFEPTLAMGRVAWIGQPHGDPGMGVQFLFRSTEARDRIERIVSSLEDQLSRGAVPTAAS